MLLQEIVRKLKESFNQQFDAILEEKKREIEKIYSRNERIEEILNELGHPEGEDYSYFRPSVPSDEIPDSVIHVSDGEVSVQKYLSVAEKERLAREEQEEKARLEARKKDDLGKRALDSMMGGTLETKSNLAALENQLVREPWMDEISFEDMTEEQQKKILDYEEKAKLISEEREKQRKGLEQEMKKLKQEVADICKAFDDKVSLLYDLKMATDTRVYRQELYITRISLSLQEKIDLRRKRAKLEEVITELTQEQSTSMKAVQEFRRRVEDFKRQVEDVKAEDLRLERNFRKDIMDASQTRLDQETVKTLVSLFRKRKTASAVAFPPESERNRSSSVSSSRRGSHSLIRRKSISGKNKTKENILAMFGNGGSALGNPERDTVNANEEPAASDPFADEPATLQYEAKNEDVFHPLDLELDAPELNVDEFVWDKLQELRAKKFVSEQEVKKVSAILSEMLSHLELLTEKNNSLEEQFQSSMAQLKRLEKQELFQDFNLDVLIRLKQGQVEIPEAPVVNDMSSSILIDRGVVEHLNTEICGLGEEKVAVLNKIRNFRKSINFNKWEQNFLEKQSADLDEEYRDLHFLKVTKSLQSALKEGVSSDKSKEEQARIEAKLEHLARSHQEKMSKVQTQIKKNESQIKIKEDENKKLDQQLKQLGASVAARQSVRRAQK